MKAKQYHQVQVTTTTIPYQINQISGRNFQAISKMENVGDTTNSTE